MDRGLIEKAATPSERKEDVLKLINNKRYCSIDEIARMFDVSKVTVHRMLNELEEEGLITKVRGGAKKYEESSFETRFTARLRANRELKEEIALKALPLVEDGDSIFLESSTTCLYLARLLAKSNIQDLTVITNGPAIGNELAKNSSIHVIMTGGEYNIELNTLGGQFTLYAIEMLQFRKVFLSALAVSTKGAMTSISLLLDIKRKLMEGDREFNLLIDSTKFTGIAPHMIMPVSTLKRIITDSGIDLELVKEYEALGVEMLY